MVTRIDLLIFGYRKIKINTDDTGIAASLLLRSAIPAKIGSDGVFCIRLRDMKKMCGIFDGVIEYSASEPLGLYGTYLGLKNKAAILSAIGVSIILVLLSQMLVWDIRIEGNENLPDGAIEYALGEAGLSVGDVWGFVDKSDVERALLQTEPMLSWVNINRRGNVAYVEVCEKNKNTHTPIIEVGYANIVSSCDCVIEEISVTNGVAAVKRGDTVKAGDILISGVVSTENGSELCYAEGTVIGRLNDTVTVNVERQYEIKKQKNESLIRKDMKIFNFDINIFKKYRNSSLECDIIEDVKVFSLFGKCELPIKTVSTYEITYETVTAFYSDAQLVNLASLRLGAATHKRLILADLIKIKTYGDFTESGYSMSSDIEFLAEVGKAVAFDSE